MIRRPVIKFEKVTKTFLINRENTFKSSFKELFIKKKVFTSLKDVSFSIFPNEIVGLYGPNGSGKSVILKLIAGILKPDLGNVTVSGKVAPVIELGAGLHPELTGRENIYLFSSILGMPKKLILSCEERIIAISGIHEFIDTPVKKYSSGMKARLGFAIAVTAKPDIILLDELFSVGDSEFQAQCEEILHDLKREMTVIVTSHNMKLLTTVCDRIMFINEINKEYHLPSLISFVTSLPYAYSFCIEALSSSMSPTIKPGDKLVIKKVKYNSLKKSDIIAFYNKSFSNVLIHRIKRINKGKKNTFITQGDNLNYEDFEVVRENNFIGKVFEILN